MPQNWNGCETSWFIIHKCRSRITKLYVYFDLIKIFDADWNDTVCSTSAVYWVHPV